MVDTIRKRLDILALWADNTAGNISPQDGRDFVITSMGGYGGVHTKDSTTSPITCTISTERTLPTFDLAMPVADVVTDVVNGTLTVPVDGVYIVLFSVSASFDTVNTTCNFKLALDGVATDFEKNRVFGSIGAAGALAIHGILTCTAGQVISIRVETDKTADIQVHTGQLITKIWG